VGGFFGGLLGFVDFLGLWVLQGARAVLSLLPGKSASEWNPESDKNSDDRLYFGSLVISLPAGLLHAYVMGARDWRTLVYMGVWLFAMLILVSFLDRIKRQLESDDGRNSKLRNGD